VSAENLIYKGRIREPLPTTCKICNARLHPKRQERYRNFCSSKCFVKFYRKSK
jgi:hypothetical protein